jgi:methylmalonyl-CoA mutase N-terminal domain/subunit
MVPCIEAGWIQKEIHRSAVLYQRAIEQKTKNIVGVNCYTEGEGGPKIEVLKLDPKVEADQHRRLAALRKKRDAKKAKKTLDDVRDAAKGSDNLLERFVAAAHADCTLGEIAGVLREVYGEYKEPKIL